MPSYVIHKQLHNLSKVQVIQSYKNVGKDLIMNRLQTLPSQTMARAAADSLDRDVILERFFNNKNVAA